MILPPTVPEYSSEKSVTINGINVFGPLTVAPAINNSILKLNIDDDDDDFNDDMYCSDNSDNEHINEKDIAVGNRPKEIEIIPLMKVPNIPPISLYNISSVANNILILLYSTRYKYVQFAIVSKEKYVNDDDSNINQNFAFINIVNNPFFVDIFNVLLIFFFVPLVSLLLLIIKWIKPDIEIPTNPNIL